MTEIWPLKSGHSNLDIRTWPSRSGSWDMGVQIWSLRSAHGTRKSHLDGHQIQDQIPDQAPDIGPNYTGNLFGSAGSIGMIAAVFSPLAAGFILENTNSWFLIFNISTIVLFFGGIFYLFFSSADKQFD